MLSDLLRMDRRAQQDCIYIVHRCDHRFRLIQIARHYLYTLTKPRGGGAGIPNKNANAIVCRSQQVSHDFAADSSICTDDEFHAHTIATALLENIVKM